MTTLTIVTPENGDVSLDIDVEAHSVQLDEWGRLIVLRKIDHDELATTAIFDAGRWAYFVVGAEDKSGLADFND